MNERLSVQSVSCSYYLAHSYMCISVHKRVCPDVIYVA